MPQTKSIVGDKAREKIIKGMDYLVNAVRETLGPFSRDTVLEKGNKVTNDGFNTSRAVAPSIKDEFERRGALLVDEVATRTNDQVGDATTTSEILTQEIVKELDAYLSHEGSFAAKMKPAELIQKLKDEKDLVLKKLEEKSKKIESEEELINSARISIEDEELAQLVGKAQWQIGENGFILAEETAEYKSSIERVKGIKIDNGFGTSALINNQEKNTLESDDCYTILTNHTLLGGELLEKTHSDGRVERGALVGLIRQLISLGKKKIIIIARAFSSEAIRVCLEACQNGVKDGIMIIPINAPFTNQREVMLDLQAVLGGTYIDSEEKKLELVGIDDVGFASKLIARRYDAIIAGTDDVLAQSRVSNRVLELEKKLKGSLSEFEKKMIQSRIAQLTNGFAILKVGAETDAERKRKKDKCDDGVNAVRLALQGGTVKGAGLAFKEIADELTEGSLLKRPLVSIYNQIMSGATKDYQIPDWCRDPLLVLRAALINAVSVAGTIANVGCIVVSKDPHQCNCKEEENAND
jgi:chaperonin GroEL